MPLPDPLPTVAELIAAHKELETELAALSELPLMHPLALQVEQARVFRETAERFAKDRLIAGADAGMALILYGIDVGLRVAGNRQAALMKDKAAAQELFPCDGCGVEFPPSLLTALEGEIRLCANCLRESGR